MSTYVIVEATATEEIKDAGVVECIELELSDLDCIGGGSSIGDLY